MTNAHGLFNILYVLTPILSINTTRNLKELNLGNEKITVWAAINSHGLILPYFFEEDGETVTITAKRYLKIMTKTFIPAFKQKKMS